MGKPMMLQWAIVAKIAKTAVVDGRTRREILEVASPVETSKDEPVDADNTVGFTEKEERSEE